MDTKLLLLLVLSVSLLAFGCAGKKAQVPDESTEPAENMTNDTGPRNETMGEEDGMEGENDTVTETKDTGMSDLADLFKVDTDKPLEGEGLDTSTPSSEDE